MRRKVAFLLGSLLVTATGCVSGTTPLGSLITKQQVLPNTPAAQQLNQWLIAYNAANLASLTSFAASHFTSDALSRRPATDRARSDRWLFLNLGSMAVRGIESATDTSIKVIVWQDLVESWGHVTLEVEPTVPFRIKSRSVDFLEPGPVHVAGKLDHEQITADVRRFITKLANGGVFSGIVMVNHNGKAVVAESVGYASRDPDIPNTVDTRFELASVSKMFTAVAIAQLVERGKLSYGDTIAKLLPDYPNQAAARRLTVHHLLTHTSGISEYLFKDAYRAERSRVRSPKDYWPFFANDSLEFAPGSQWSYSTSNYVLLGAIIERASGQSFYEYRKRHIFDVAGMTSTDGDGTGPVATPFTRFGPNRVPDLERYRPVLEAPDRRGSPGGGGVSTAGDLQRFIDALLSHKLLSATALHVATAPRVKAEEGEWSYGFESHDWNGVRFFGHNGFAGGAFSQVDVFPESGYSVVVLSNVDMSGAGAVAYHLRLLLTQSPGPNTKIPLTR